MYDWLNERLLIASEETYRDLSNIQGKVMKHRTFEAEIQANKERLDDICEVRRPKRIIKHCMLEQKFPPYIFEVLIQKGSIRSWVSYDPLEASMKLKCFKEILLGVKIWHFGYPENVAWMFGSLKCQSPPAPGLIAGIRLRGWGDDWCIKLGCLSTVTDLNAVIVTDVILALWPELFCVLHSYRRETTSPMRNQKTDQKSMNVWRNWILSGKSWLMLPSRREPN